MGSRLTEDLDDDDDCPRCSTRLEPHEHGHTMCRKCAEEEIAKLLGEGILDLPREWYDTPT
jgi:hypothetical protein